MLEGVINRVSTGIPGSGFQPGKSRKNHDFSGLENNVEKPGNFWVPGWNSEKFPDSSKFRVRTRNSGFRDVFPGCSKFRVGDFFPEKWKP